MISLVRNTGGGRKPKASENIAWEMLNENNHHIFEHHCEMLAPHFTMLTKQELRIAALSGQMPENTIARALAISERTVEKHCENIRRKIGMPGNVPLKYALSQFYVHVANERPLPVPLHIKPRLKDLLNSLLDES
jgi:DNA-binding NarL/FixJ family response regulator